MKLLGTLLIIGNHESLTGNPVPYERMTQRSKYKDDGAKRYIAWQEFVQLQWLKQVGKLPDVKNGRYKISVSLLFKGENHGDPDNIFKGLIDSIFAKCGDKHVYGSVVFAHTGDARQKPELRCIVMDENF